MAIIYSYPLTTPKVKDLLIGTSVFDEDDENSPRNNPTVSFTIKSLLDMIGTGGFQTLQQVTNLGASTTNAITIANGLSVTGTFTDSTGGVGTAGQVLSSTSIGTAWINDNAGLNYYVTGAAFDTTTGILAITGNNALVGASIDLDGRYLQGTGLATKIAFWDNTTSLSFDTNLQWIDQGVGFDDYLMIDNKVVSPALSTKGIKIFADSAGGQIHGGRPTTVNPLYYRAEKHFWLTKNGNDSYKTTMQLSQQGILSLRESSGIFSIHSNVAYNLSASNPMDILFSARYNIAGNEQYVGTIKSSKLNTTDGDKLGQMTFSTSTTNGTQNDRLKLSDTSVLISNAYLELSNYGSGTITGTSTYNLSVDSTGKVIETANVVSGVTTVNSSPLFAYKGILVTPTTGAVVVGLNINDLPVLPAAIADEDVMVIVDDPSGTGAGVKNHKTTVGDLKTHINTNTTYDYLAVGSIPSGTVNSPPMGSGYSSAINVATTGGSGTGMTVDTTVDGAGGVQTVTINNPGTGYAIGDNDIVISGGDGGLASQAIISLSGTVGETNPNLRLVDSAFAFDDVKLTGSGGTTITRTSDTGITISSTSGAPYTLPVATSTDLGGVKIGYTQTATRDYPVTLDAEKMLVTVPWTDTGVTGSGIQFTLPMWDNVAGTNLGDSIISQNAAGSEVNVTANLAIFKTTSDTDLNSGVKITRSSNSDSSYINMVGGIYNFVSYDDKPISFRTSTSGGHTAIYVKAYTNQPANPFVGNAVGISTTTPTQRLEVSGALKVSGSGYASQQNVPGFVIDYATSESRLKAWGVDNSTVGFFSIKQSNLNNSTEYSVLASNQTGQLIAGTYGSGTVTGTPTYNLSVDSAGKIIETASPSTSLLKTVTNKFTASQIFTGGSLTFTMPTVPVGKQLLIQNALWYIALYGGPGGPTYFNAPSGYTATLEFDDGFSSINLIPLSSAQSFFNSIDSKMSNSGSSFDFPLVLGDIVTTGGGTMELILPTGASGNAPTTGDGELYISIEYKEIATGSAFTL